MAVLKPLIVCDGFTGASSLPKCDIYAFIGLVKNGIYDLVIISTLLFVVVMVIAGIKLLYSGGDPGALKELKGRFQKILTGYAIILVAWVLVYTIAKELLDPKFYFFFGK
jgi:hypothetical protein